jgi:hypothetical protein
MVWVIMGDGYTSFEMDEFHSDTERVIHDFFAVPPWSEYHNFINIYRIDVISNESGADHPSLQTYVDTALHATYDTYGISRLLTVDDAKAFEIASSVPSFDLVMVIVNDNTYGGSGGATMVLSNHEKSGRIALHEAGHLIADLADEYETPYPGYPEGDEEPNVTFHTDLKDIPWKNWITETTPLPTPETSDEYGVGLYEGARYLSEGIFRSTFNSLMRSLGAPYGPINSEALILNLYNYVDPIDWYLPDSSTVFLPSSTEEFHFMVKLVAPSERTMQVRWEIDGKTRKNGDEPTLTIDPSALTQGTHQVMVVVTDSTSMVKSDLQDLLYSSRSWTIEKKYASGGVRGTVTNSLTRRGLAGVLIETKEGDFSTTTKEDGSYLLSSMSEGYYTLIARSDRYRDDIDETIMITDGQVSTIDIALEPLFTTYAVTGTILGSHDEEISLELKNGEDFSLSCTADTKGNYSFEGLENGVYTITPVSHTHTYTFTPFNYTVEVKDKNVSQVDFTSFPQLCPSEVALQGDATSLTLLRQLRDDVLIQNTEGERYRDLYYQHAPELTMLVILHDDIRNGVGELLEELTPGIKSLVAGEEALLKKEIVKKIEELIAALRSQGSAQLRNSLKEVEHDMHNPSFLYSLGVNTLKE